MNAYHVIGSAFVLWALTLTAVGVRRDDFPRSGGQTLAVGAASVLLAAGTIGAAIVTGALEDEEHEAEASGGAGRTLELRADPGGDLRFDKDSLEARAGRVTLVMKNPSPVPHNISLGGHGQGDTVSTGGTSSVSADLAAGRYTYFCSVPGHREAGMRGTLTVR